MNLNIPAPIIHFAYIFHSSLEMIKQLCTNMKNVSNQQKHMGEDHMSLAENRNLSINKIIILVTFHHKYMTAL